MVVVRESLYSGKSKNKIKADVIVLGCSLPGIVTAHQLKKRFGDSMDIVVLDLIGPTKFSSRCSVAFKEVWTEDDKNPQMCNLQEYDRTARQLIDNVARHYLAKFAREFNIPLPDSVVAPEKEKSDLVKVFQHRDGKAVPVECDTEYHDYHYLSFLEKFELNQYQTLLDQNMRVLFQTHQELESDRDWLLFYDQTTMEKHICDALFFNTSREIMRTTVKLVCGASASCVSVLFYLHQCYRTSSSTNHLDGNNTRFREKLFGYCKKRIAHKLQESVADITQAVICIKEIRTYANEVMVETMKGEANYVCNLLAMALKPDELHTIQVEEVLLSEPNAKVTRNMVPGYAKKFVIQYDYNFWSRQGYSGDIMSIQGPIIWAMERPKFSTTGSTERYVALIGFLMTDKDGEDSREAVIKQLVKLFGEEAANPTSYKETDVADVFVPHCGDYVAVRKLTTQESPKFMVWASLDIFADGDVASALEAGNTAYLHLLSSLRPQAQTYEDVCSGEWPTFLSESPMSRWLAQINIKSSIKWSIIIGVTTVAIHALKSLMKK